MVDNGYRSWDASTPLNNGSVDSTINWQEGQLPSTVNNSSRAEMSRLAQYFIDDSGSNVIGGTANALTMTPLNVLTSYVTGMTYGIIPTADNTAAATLNINGAGVKAIRRIENNADVVLNAKDLMRKHLHILRYDATANSGGGAWILMNPATSWDGNLVTSNWLITSNLFPVTDGTAEIGTNGSRILQLATRWVNFPATQSNSGDPNTLDDYEEAAFTPTYMAGGVSTGVAYTSQSGRYTKLGNRVFGDIRIVLSSKGSAVGAVSIGNLPFTIGTMRNGGAPGAITSMTGLTGAIVVYLASSGTEIFLRQSTATGNGGITDANMTNTTDIALTFNYEVA